MRIKNKTYGVPLSLAQVAALKELATKNAAMSRSGPTTGNPSWRVLVAMIADGTLSVCLPPRPPRKKKKKGKKGGIHPHFVPGWWQPGPNDDMPVAAVLEATGLTVEQVSAAGLLLVDDGKHFMAPSEWVKWCRDLDEEPKEPPATKAKAEPKDDDSASIEKMLGETN